MSDLLKEKLLLLGTKKYSMSKKNSSLKLKDTMMQERKKQISIKRELTRKPS
jgi:hypothetical protein